MHQLLTIGVNGKTRRHLLTKALLILTLMLLCLAPARADALETYSFIKKWGSEGASNGQFDLPMGIAVDSRQNVYVADTFNDRIQKFSPNGNFIKEWGELGDGEGDFDGPTGLAVGPGDVIYVADSGNERIQKFNSNGAFITEWGGPGEGNGEFDSPSSVAVDPSGNVYVSDDFGEDDVQKFSSNGTYISRCCDSYGLGPGIGVNAVNSIFAINQRFAKVERWVSGVKTKQWSLPCIPDPGGLDVCVSAETLAVDNHSKIFVPILYMDKITKYSADGTKLAEWGEYGTGDAQFDSPTTMATDKAGNVYVVDTGNSRIQKFAPANQVTMDAWTTTSTVLSGNQGRVAGTLKDSAGRIGSAPVYIQKYIASSNSWAYVATVNTDSNGFFDARFVPSANATYRAYFNRGNGYPSNSVLIKVAAKASLAFIPASPVTLGTQLLVLGWVSPAHTGHTVYVQWYSFSENKWKWMKTASTSSLSNFYFWWTPPWRGTWALRGVTAGDADHVGGVGPTAWLTVQ